jgi:hypothetical protein
VFGGKKKPKPRPKSKRAPRFEAGTARVVGGVGVVHVGERLLGTDPLNTMSVPAWPLDLVDWSTGLLLQRLLLPEDGVLVERPLTDEATAREMLNEVARTRMAGVEEWSERYRRLRRVLEKAEPIPLAQGLSELYAITEPNFGGERLTEIFEQCVLGEIALVLREPYADLRARVRTLRQIPG